MMLEKCTAPPHPAFSLRRSLRFYYGCEVWMYAYLRGHDADADMAGERLDLAVFHVPEAGGRGVDFGPTQRCLRTA